MASAQKVKTGGYNTMFGRDETAVGLWFIFNRRLPANPSTCKRINIAQCYG